MRRAMMVLLLATCFSGCGKDDEPNNPGTGDVASDVEVSAEDTTTAAEVTQTDTSEDTDSTVQPDTEIDTAVADVQDEEVVATQFGLTVTPALEEWTPDYTALTDCTCATELPDCHALYKGRAVAVNGNIASLEFEKTPSGAPSVAVSYWVVVGDATEPSCMDTEAFVTRVEGIWDGGVLSVDVPIWLDEAAFDAALVGEQKKLFVITGGSGDPATRLWFQRQAVVFEKVAL